MRTAAPPRVDGALDDPCWASAATLNDFTLQEQQQPLSFPTTAYVCYDKLALYVGMRADDPEPASILAQETRRDGSLDRDDVLSVAVDPRHQFQDYFDFRINPNGAQSDEFPSGSASNITWRGDWRGAAGRTPTGWSAEFAIPWKLLLPPRDSRAIGIFFRRKVGRLSDWAECPNMGQRGDRRDAAEVVGLELADVVLPPRFLPYLQFGLRKGMQARGGLDIKQQNPTGRNWLVTMFPDFESIEQSVQSVDFSYTGARQISDARPFFAEGSALFPTSDLFYTPYIGKVTAAAKAFDSGQGRFTYAGLTTLGEQAQQNAALALRYRFRDKPNRSMWLNNVYHHERGILNHIINTGGNLEFAGKGGWSEFDWNLSQSRTTGADGDGTSMGAALRYNANPSRLSYGASVQRIGAFFNPMLGYLPDRDYFEKSAWISLYDNLPTGPIETYGAYFSAGSSDRLNGDPFTNWRRVSLWADLRPNTWVSVAVGESYRNPYHDNVVALGYGWNRRSLYRSGSAYVEIGHTNGGVRRYLSVGNGLRLWGNLGLTLNVEYSKIHYPPARQEPDYRRAQCILSLTYDITRERSIGGRLVAGGSGFGDIAGRQGRQNYYFTFRQAVRRGVDAFLIAGDPNAETWQPRAALKLVAPF